MKRIFAILISALMLMYMLPVSGNFTAKAEDNPAITASEATVLPGQRAAIDLTISNNPGINSLAIKIAYDKNNLTIVDTKDGIVFAGTDTTLQESTTYDANPYVAAWMCIENKNIKKDGKLFSITFEAAQNASYAACLIDISIREAYDKDGNRVMLEDVDGAVYITPTTAHTVVFRDWDGKVVSAQSIEHGKAAQAPQNPVREGYVFTGWDKDFSNVVEDMEITALYDVQKFTVTFLDFDGELIANTDVEYGKAAQAPEPPVHEGRTFNCWDGDFSCVKSNITVKARYDTIQCAVLFVDYDNMPILRVMVDYGTSAKAPSAPEREGYTFTGWDKDISHVTSDMTVKALYTVNTYTVNYYVDGALYTSQKYEYGQAVTPAQAPTGDGTFSGWSDIPATMPAHNVNVFGAFSEKYTVIFEDWDGTPLSVQQLNAGESAAAPSAPEREGFNFTGWDRDFSAVTENMIVTAQYEPKKYIVSFYDWDDTFLGNSETEWGMPAQAPAIPGREGYKFAGWDKDISCIKSDMTVKAQYVPAKCYVTFTDADDSVLKIQEVQYGGNATPPQIIPPVGFDFTGWDKPYTNITEDVTIKAQYREQMFIVVFKDGSTTISTQQIKYGEAASEPESKPFREGYMFKGWDKDFSYIISNLTVNAMFVKCCRVTFFDTVANEIIEAQSVEQHASASAPKAPEHEGYTFNGWDKAFGNITEDITVKTIYELDAVTGDVNVDGKVNTADAVVVLKYAAGMVQLDATQLVAANTNRDDKVNTADAVLILKYSAGMITEF